MKLDELDPSTMALNIILNYISALEKHKRIELSMLASVANRVAEYPVLVLQTGLLAATTFYLSKLDEGYKRRALKTSLLILNNGIVSDDELNSLEREVKREGGGYSVALAFLLKALDKGGYIKLNINHQTEIDKLLENIIEQLKRLSSTEESIAAEAYILEIFNELKKLSFALFKA